jgi:hypothetical protein
MKLKIKSVLRKLSRAYHAQDAKTFDEGLEELEEKLEEGAEDETPEEAIEIHNHIPGGQDAMGELPSRESSVSSPAFDGEEAPPWAKKMQEANDAMFKKMGDEFEAFKKKHEGEGEDRRGHDESEEEERGEEEHLGYDNEEENLEMEDRQHNDRRHDDRRDRRDRRNDDEANKEILGELEFEAPPGTGDRARRAKDSAFLEEAFQDAVAKAEVLSPGIDLPTFDRAAPPTRTAKAIFSLRRSALDSANKKAASREVISQAMSGRALDSKRMSIASTRVLFNAVAGAMASQNNTRATDHSVTTRGGGGTVTGPQSIADINARNAAFYNKKRA